MRACRDCGSPIRWEKEHGRWVPMDLSGTDHRKTCFLAHAYDPAIHHAKAPKAKMTEPATPKIIKKSGRVMQINSRAQGPADFRNCQDCTIPPWEICPSQRGPECRIAA